MDPIRTKNKAFGPMLKRCFCTLKLNKKKPPSKHFKKKKSVFRGPPRKQVKINKSKQPKAPSKRIMETKSIQQGTVTKNVPTHQTPKTANRKHRSIPYKLLPYECEPGVCVPGECDPYECARRIKKRVLHRASSTVKTRHRARSNMIRPHRKYRDSNAQSTFSTYDAATGGTRPTATGVHRPKYGNTAFETPLRPAVKIGSKISFDMEFYKDGSSKDIIVNSRQLQRYSPYDKPRRTSSRSTGWQTLSSRNKGGQYTKAVRDIDSQSVAGKMRSTMTNVGPYLKRCFCTAQLDKSKKAVWPNTKVVAYRATVAKAPIAKPSITKTPVANKPAAKSKKSGEATKKDAINGTKSKQSRKKPKIKFEPSECEPDFCIPGQCDPYKCVKRIKKRNKSKGSRCECPITYKDTIGTPPGQEVVCFGSNLRFNIEFFKDDSPGDLGDYVTTETKRRTISTSSSSRLQDGYTQSDCIKYNCKASCARLKKCFCTLKLQKKGKQKPAVVEGEPIMKSMGTRTAAQKKKDLIVTREIGTKTKNYSNLMPYECQPGVCIPGLCNPYDCEKRIQLRHMKTFGTRASILTLKEQGTKAMKVNRRPSTNTLYRAKPSPHQSVRLGSNMSFRMEFYKESSDNLHDKEMVRKHRISQAIASTESKTSGKGSLLKRCFCTLTLQKAELKKSSPKPKKVKPGKAKPKKVKPEKAKPKKVKPEKVKPEKVKPEKVKPEKAKPKKVKPEKAKPKKVKPEKVKPEKVKPEKAKPKKVKPEKVKPEKVQTQDKATATKKKNKQSVVASRPIPTYQNLDPYECEPYVCIPGQCDPYECLEKIKKRGVRRTSRTTAVTVPAKTYTGFG
ncbi:unnamed protein product [Chrysodeixis includens]|uniref:Uncharacterized protein n=1 Tax=Chrysodeixis includens TaxID=689277 RepID=A0A9P0BWK5_CHRIL|nr:unnamed protein product [Chrysodeixis includens]